MYNTNKITITISDADIQMSILPNIKLDVSPDIC